MDYAQIGGGILNTMEETCSKEEFEEMEVCYGEELAVME